MKKDNVMELIKNRENYLRKIAFLEREIDAINGTNEDDIYSLVYPNISYEARIQKAKIDPIPLQVGAIEKLRIENKEKLQLLSQELFLLRQKVRRLEDAVELLPHDQCQVVKMRYYDGATIKKTASDMLMSDSSVYNVTRRAINNLYDLLN